MNCWVASIAKQEERYIREWIEWNISIGIDHILLADNNDVITSPMNDSLLLTIKDYVDSGYVEVFDYRGQIAPQIRWCNHALKVAKDRGIEWLAIIDVDEFISDNVFSILFNRTSTVSLPWRVYDDNDLLHYDPRPVMERFTRIVNLQYNNKSVCKSIWHTPTIKTIISNHCPQATLLKVTGDEQYFVDHYMFKSTEEYINKAKRGRVRAVSPKRYTKDLYFKWNKWTQDKEDLFQLYNIT